MMMKKILVILFLMPFVTSAQFDSISSGIYLYKEPVDKNSKITSLVLMEGRAYDFEWMQLSVNINSSVKKIKQQVATNEEQVLIIKSGTLTLQLNDSTFQLTPGSIAVLVPLQIYSIRSDEIVTYYTMKYKKKLPVNMELMKSVGGSFVKIYENITYKPNNNGGGRRDYFEKPTALQKRFEIHVSTLKEGIRSHEPHTHRAEEIVLMINGNTEMLIGDKTVKGNIGDFYYLGSNVLHAIKNIGKEPCMYFAIQFE